MKYSVDYKTKESEIYLKVISNKKSCTLNMHRLGDFSTHHTIEDCFTALTQMAIKIGCCHNQKEYWERLLYIAKEKIK